MKKLTPEKIHSIAVDFVDLSIRSSCIDAIKNCLTDMNNSDGVSRRQFIRQANTTTKTTRHFMEESEALLRQLRSFEDIWGTEEIKAQLMNLANRAAATAVAASWAALCWSFLYELEDKAPKHRPYDN